MGPSSAEVAELLRGERLRCTYHTEDELVL